LAEAGWEFWLRLSHLMILLVLLLVGHLNPGKETLLRSVAEALLASF
jgi:hypothetical protein